MNDSSPCCRSPLLSDWQRCTRDRIFSWRGEHHPAAITLPPILVSTSFVSASFAQTNTQATNETKSELKQDEKAHKAQAKADKAQAKALNTKQKKKKADKAQDKADRQADKTITPQ